MREYLTMKVNNGEVLGISCTGCGTEMKEKDIRIYLTEHEFAKYHQFRFFAQLRFEPNSRWCPKRGCGSGVIGNPDDRNFPKLSCGNCNTDYCFNCSLKWHEGLTCQQKRKRREKHQSNYNKYAMKKNKRWMKENKYVKCSKCGHAVQKESGCNHMTCSCGHEFCWLCGDSIMSLDLHYSIGACAYLQFSDKEELGFARQTVRVGMMAGMVGVGGILALGLAVPAVAVGVVAVPLYGGYRLVKHRKEKANRRG